MALEKIDTDYAGLIYHRKKCKKESKAYIFIVTIFTCSMRRAIHLELVRNLKAKEFIKCLKD